MIASPFLMTLGILLAAVAFIAVAEFLRKIFDR
jgi:hypothetical protein